MIGFTRRILGVPKAESDAILSFLFHQISENPDHQVRFKWETNSIAIWDNRVGLVVPLSYLRMDSMFTSRLSLIPQLSISGLQLDMLSARLLTGRGPYPLNNTRKKQERLRKIDRLRYGKTKV